MQTNTLPRSLQLRRPKFPAYYYNQLWDSIRPTAADQGRHTLDEHYHNSRTIGQPERGHSEPVWRTDRGGTTRAEGSKKQQGEARRRRRWLGRSLQPAVKFSLVYVALSTRQCQNRHTSATLPRSLFLLVVRPSASDSLH